MGTYKEINGDLIELALNAEFDVIVHGCNCQNVMGLGIAPQMAKAFGCDRFPLEDASFKGDINKLGQIDYEKVGVWKGIVLNNYREDAHWLHVVNAYTQYRYGRGLQLDYEALILCLRKINHIFKGRKIGLPQIGCGLAGGKFFFEDLSESEYDDYLCNPNEYKFVKDIILRELKDCDVTVVIYNPL